MSTDTEVTAVAAETEAGGDAGSPPPPSRVRARRRKGKDAEQKVGPVWTLVAWVLTLLFFAPVAWMVLTSLHIEADAASNPPSVFAPITFENYGALFDRDVLPYLINSGIASVVSTLLVLVLAVPAAYALSIRPVEKWTDVMFFFLSTKFLPPIAALLPIYLIVQNAGMLDNIFTLVILYTSMNLPIAVWMMRSFLVEVPIAILESASLDGAGLIRTLVSVVDADRCAGNRCDQPDLLHLQLERVHVRGEPHLGRGRHVADLPGRVHLQPGPVPRQAVRRRHPGLAARADRRIRCPGQAGPGVVAGRGQVTNGPVCLELPEVR